VLLKSLTKPERRHSERSEESLILTPDSRILASFMWRCPLLTKVILKLTDVILKTTEVVLELTNVVRPKTQSEPNLFGFVSVIPAQAGIQFLLLSLVSRLYTKFWKNKPISKIANSLHRKD
jgi:hypothetical protein